MVYHAILYSSQEGSCLQFTAAAAASALVVQMNVASPVSTLPLTTLRRIKSKNPSQ